MGRQFWGGNCHILPPHEVGTGEQYPSRSLSELRRGDIFSKSSDFQRYPGASTFRGSFDYLTDYLPIFRDFSLRKMIYSLGAIFDSENTDQRDAAIQAFEAAINDINDADYDFIFEGEVEVISYDDPHEAMSVTCSLLENGIIAIFGPSSEENSNVIQSICDLKEIPHIEVRWDDHPQNGTIINLHPFPDVLTRTYISIIDAWGWKDFVILYENNESLQRVGELLKSYLPAKHRIVVRRLNPVDGYINLLKDLRNSGATHFVLDCSLEILEEVLRQAQKVGLMTSEHNYIITNLDLHTIELEPYQHSDTNITGMAFVNPLDGDLVKVANQIYPGYGEFAGWRMRLEEALIYDAVRMFAEGINAAKPLSPVASTGCDEDTEDKFSSGTSIINFMRTLEYKGLTGVLKFDVTGFRTSFGLDILNLKEGGITVIGSWDSTEEPRKQLKILGKPLHDIEDMSNLTFTVIICLTEPYGMQKFSTTALKGNDRYEGFAIDIIHELSLMRGFNYTIIIEPNANNGKFDDDTGRWVGMLGDVIYGRADLAIADLTITTGRERGVDFTYPFMMVGISILYEKPKKAPPSFFSFADPFSFEVWKLLMVACPGVSVILFILGRISPTEWENPYPCIEEPEFLVNQLDLRNSFWFMTGAILQQGSEIELKSISTRMVAGMWWFFTLLMVASYTANLAAFLTTESPDNHFTTFEELVDNAEARQITYGAKAKGATETFFSDKANSTDPYYRRAWEFMRSHYNEVMAADNDVAVKMAEKGHYAFFMESSSIEYVTQRHCNLNKVGKELDEKGYGIAMRKNQPYRNSLNTAILELQSSGEIEKLRRRWWNEKRGGGQCAGDDAEEAAALDLKNVGGVFWVTVGGMLFAIPLALFEAVLNTKRQSRRSKRPFKTALKDEAQFYLKLGEMVKPVVYSNGEEGESCNNKSQDKELPYEMVSKFPSVDTVESNQSGSGKTKKSKKEKI
ncbi:hypothetical protein NQ317_000424 [Molorchus minor]|uniref:Uncharacterized protein n=1 Tax=Molorchus minor TaxID=1323400 RepID=A0ABQ9JX95_9CUCU|nr:hypothetical protein NQ317_000424 [Molorchus minor]